MTHIDTMKQALAKISAAQICHEGAVQTLIAEADDLLCQAIEEAQKPAQHWSDCAVNNGPAYPAGECDCGGYKPEQPAQQEPVATYHGSNDFGHDVIELEKALPIGAKLYTSPPAQRERVVFPTMLRKIWSGGEVQAWLDENVNKENT